MHYRSKQKINGHWQRMYVIWREIGLFNLT